MDPYVCNLMWELVDSRELTHGKSDTVKKHNTELYCTLFQYLKTAGATYRYVYHKQRFSHEYRHGIVVKGYVGRDLSLFLTYKGQRRVDLCTVITLPPFSSELSSRQSTGKVFRRVGLFTFQSEDTRTLEQFTIVLLSAAASYPALLLLGPNLGSRKCKTAKPVSDFA